MNKKLRALIDRAERLIAEREEAAESIRDLRKEVKSGGWDAAQIMRLAQLSHDDKKRAKLAATNEMLALYNRESGLGLDLGLDESEAPSGATAAIAGSKAVTAPPAASDTPSPAGGPPPTPTDPGRVAASSPSSDAVPAGEPDGGPESASLAVASAAASREGQDSAGNDDADWEKRDSEATFALGMRLKGGKEPMPEGLEIPAFLDRRRHA